jgi:hypothetical protein
MKFLSLNFQKARILKLLIHIIIWRYRNLILTFQLYILKTQNYNFGKKIYIFDF